MKKIALFGSTGSIGTQTTSVVDEFSDRLELCILSAHSNTTLLLEQIKKYHPQFVFVTNQQSFELIQKECENKSVEVLYGWDSLSDVLSSCKIDIAIGAISGFAGILPTLICIEHNLTIGLANKETLVAGGDLVKKALQQHPTARIIPVDSEHSAIFQCLEENQIIDKILLTASGGPFHTFTGEQLKHIKPKDALKHPNWSMGQKITIDSATLMNKGLEVIEAQRLFQVNYDDIQVLVHPQSIVHSMVQYQDGSILAQLGQADMRVPIQYSIFYPKRMKNSFTPFDFGEFLSVTFQKPNTELFPALPLAFEAGRIGKSMPCVLNAANEIAVHAFLKEQIDFLDIVAIVREMMNEFPITEITSLEELFELDTKVRSHTTNYINRR